MKSTESLRTLPKIDRPREKLIKYGPEKLSEAELLAIILRTGRKGQNVLALSQKILKKFKGTEISEAVFADFLGIPGLGPTKSCEIVACFELGKRLLKGKKATLFLEPKDVFDALYDLRSKKKEFFIIFFLDARSQEIKREVISIGTLSETLVHPREVFEPAVRHSASQIIIAHNHPSGDTLPSESDIDITRRLIYAANILGIDLIDHIIVSSKHFYSFGENNLMRGTKPRGADILTE